MKPQTKNYKRYYEALKASSNPVKKSELPNVVADYRGLIAYAREKGVAVTELSQEEKNRYVKIVL